MPEAEKSSARRAAASALARDDRPPLVYVRINGLHTVHALDDLEAVVSAAPNGIMLPMASSEQDVATVDWLLSQFERRAGIKVLQTRIVPLIETAQGVAKVAQIAAASGRIAALAFGAGDFTADMNLHWSRDELELLPHRMAIVLASRTAGLPSPLDAVWVEMADTEGMAASAARARDHGFQGKLCIHPDQAALVNQAFTPTPEALAKAQRIIMAFEEAERAGNGAIQLNGKMIDQPIVASARAIVAEHESRNPLPHGESK